MTSRRGFAFPILAGLAAGVLTLTAPARVDAADACEPLNKAVDRMMAGPTHAYSRNSLSGRESESETIFVDGKTYVRVHGQWKVSPLSPAELAKQRKENLSHSTVSCRVVGEETVGGSAATVYESHAKTEAGDSDEKLWIAKSSGLLLREEETLRDTANDVTRRSARYEYSGVKPPI
jgi:outer membrane lipoprotein-sorting protein